MTKAKTTFKRADRKNKWHVYRGKQFQGTLWRLVGFWYACDRNGWFVGEFRTKAAAAGEVVVRNGTRYVA